MRAWISSAAPWLVLCPLLLLALAMLRRPLARLLRLGIRSTGALTLLALLQPATPWLGIGANWLNAVVLGALGVPGFGFLLLLQWLFQRP